MYWVHTLLRIILNELNFLLTSLNINYLHPSFAGQSLFDSFEFATGN